MRQKGWPWVKDFKLHFKNGKKELKLEINDMDSPQELQYIVKLVEALNVNMKNQGDFLEPDAIEAKEETPKMMKKLEEGYRLFEQPVLEEPVIEKPVLQKPIIEKTKIEEYKDDRFYPFADLVIPPAPQEEESPLPIMNMDLGLILQKNTTEYNVYERNGVKVFQTFYICPTCRHKGKRFIPYKEKLAMVYCHDCNTKMTPVSANPLGFPYTDEWDNFFAAGDFGLAKKEEEPVQLSLL